MLSVNNSMQFNHLHWNSTTTIVSKCWSQHDRCIIIILLLNMYEQLNKQTSVKMQEIVW